MAGQRPLTEEVAGAQDSHDGFFAGLGQHRQLDAPVLNIENGIGRVALRVDGRALPIVNDLSRNARRLEEGFRVERALGLP